MYEESIHVPLIIHSPVLFPESKQTEMLTSHVDILPTLLGLAGIKEDKIQKKLSKDHNEVHPLVGRDLTSLLRGDEHCFRANEPLYFMSDDDVTKGLNQTTATGQPYESVVQPNHIEAVITTLSTGEKNKKEMWKFARYYDNPQFWSNPGCSDTAVKKCESSDIQPNECFVTITKEESVPDQFELYNLTRDPLEEQNLANPAFATERSARVQQILARMLEEQCRQKRLSPTSGSVPGMPSCRYTEDE